MSDCIIARRGSRQTITYYIWNRYNRNTVTTYYWNRYNRVISYRYYWDRYNVVETTVYNWNRYNVTTQTVYKWSRYNVEWDEDYYDRYGGSGSNSCSLVNNSTSSISYWQALDNSYSDLYRCRIEFSDDGTIDRVIATGGSSSYEYDYGLITKRTLSIGSLITHGRNDVTILEGAWTSVSRENRRKYIINGGFLGNNYLSRLTASNSIDGEGTDGNYLNMYEIVPTKGSYSGEYRSAIKDYKPENGYGSDGYWYEYVGQETEQTQGSANSTVTSTSSSTYPQDGIQGNYWYVYTGTTTEYSRGSANGSVNSTNRSQYPNNGRSGNYWYIYDRSTTSYSQGSYIDQVTSTNRSQYPDNNYSGNYWYVYSTSNISYIQGSYIDQVISLERNTYPDNNYSGNYWYVYQGTAEEVVTNQASLNSILSQ